MLQVPRLDDLTYQEIFERARGKIASLTQEWTDYNYHDPGITTLSTFAWLEDTLNYYLNAVGEPHRLKYLKLLGIRPTQEAAQCVLAFEAQGAYCLPRGARVCAEGVTFEVTRTVQGAASNQLLYLYHEIDDTKWDVTELAGLDGQYATVFTLDKKAQAAVYFGFAQPLHGQFSIYVQTSAPQTRNAFEGDFSLATLAFEYCDGTQWKPVQVVADETHQFLSSGLLTLAIEGEGSTVCAQGDGLQDAHYLRCRLLENEYDVLPRIGKITTQCTFARQCVSYAKAVWMRYEGAMQLPVDWCVEADDHLALWVEEKTGVFVQWFDRNETYRNRCAVRQGEHAWQREIQFGAELLLETPEEGARLLLVVTKKEAGEAVHLGKTLGVANETLVLDAENIYEFDLALIDDAHDDAQMQLWHYTDDLLAAAYDAPVFTVDVQARCVVFGDGIHGMQVPAKRRVVAVNLSTSQFAGGNVLAGSIQQLRSPALGIVRVENLADATGGVQCVSSAALEAQIEDMLTKTTRAITADDYKTLAKQTPGLMIDSVQVVPMQQYVQHGQETPAHNTVVVVVKPYSLEPCPVLSENYRKMICKHLEQYRLLTTSFRVESVRYVQVSVSGRVQLRENGARTQAQVKQMVTAFLDGSSRGAFGQAVQLSKLFAQLELLGEVRKVEQLNLEYTGAAGQKNQHGDIVLAPDALAYPAKIALEFIL